MPRRPVATLLALVLLLSGACSGPGSRDPSDLTLMPGTPDAPREVNLIAKDFLFLPEALELVPGETVRLQLVNGGLVVHEAVIGETAVQDAWEAAESATVGAPPGPTPVVSVAPEVQGIRLVVGSGERLDHTWTVPADRPALIVGCHIPGHWAEGMRIPVRWLDPNG